MRLLTTEQLKALAEKRDETCVSIYMPTHRAAPETKQDPVRLKNLVSQVADMLADRGMRSLEVEEFFEPVRRLEADMSFWERRSDGLAVFRAGGFFEWYRLPASPPEVTVVSSRFHLKPLLGLLSNNGMFYVLAVSQNRTRLLQCTRFSQWEVHVDEMPASLAEVLKYDDPEEQLQLHAGVRVGRGARRKESAVFHGHGVGRDDATDNILRYFHRIHAGLREVLRGGRLPLVFAGVEQLYGLFRKTSDYPHLMEPAVLGNPDDMREEDLRMQAWDIVWPVFQRAQEEAREKYAQLRGGERASSRVGEIAVAAYDGRVESLFAAVGQEIWGRFDPEHRHVHVHEREEPGDEDLGDFAAVHTLLTGGAVYIVEPEEVPNGGPLAAVFRY